MRERPIIVAEFDAQRLRGLLAGHSEAVLRDQEHLQELKAELERAYVLQAEQVPSDVVTLDAQVQVLDLASGERRQYVLVLPSEADVSLNRISVLAPLGTALLGFREGDEVEWEMPGGLKRLRIERVIQPEALKGAGGAAGPAPAAAGAH